MQSAMGSHMLLPTNGTSITSLEFGELYNMPSLWSAGGIPSMRNLDRGMNLYSHQAESALHHIHLLEAQHYSVLQQIAALQQHSNDLQTQEQSWNAAILNEMSRKMVNRSLPIQALLQQSSSSHSGFPSFLTIPPIWDGHAQSSAGFPFPLVYPNQDDSLRLHLHNQAVANQQVAIQKIVI
jgi:hypothetical protein